MCLCWLSCWGELISPCWLSDVIFTDSWAGVCHRVFSVISVWVYSVFMFMPCVLRLEWTDVSSLSFGECEAMSLWVVWHLLCVCACVCLCACACMRACLSQLDSTQRYMPTVINITGLPHHHGNLKWSGVRWRGDNNKLSPVWLTSISLSHVELWLQGWCL